MWEPGVPPLDDPLRQGDLLEDVPVVGCQSGEPRANELTLVAEKKTYVVISQCCSMENHGSITLAQVRTMRVRPDRPQSVTFLAALRAQPPIDPDLGLHVPTNYFLLEPYPTGVREGRVKMVDLTELRTVVQGDDLIWLTARRTARMTTIARRDLRSRLALFWARVTQEDGAELDALGEPLLLEPYLTDAETVSELERGS